MSTAPNPPGVEGAGEAGTVGTVAARRSALHDPLASAGAVGPEMPASPERVWRALRRADASGEPAPGDAGFAPS